ncbi:PREDICTED: putative fatty acyl-CoA reductase CG8306 [Wasmannia auropunctata]|uniref:putative fatty acyl-CoA reductase CG8306 n=1 Tax=Wasmannia auropunctata TaxID=64793 RepID=UPI0005EF1A26|nr:PREDICTED: putative fatty acyl-CoA reductase CG8306 [Wasmannia auropunctata]
MEKNAADVYIPAFYAGRSIFITGGTGFLGKALIEKLLRSCPDVAEIYVLIRPKKGLSVRERLKKILDNKLFDVLRSKQPSSFDKVIPITGNVAAENLGLCEADREKLIDKVSIIFNVAASVRFDESLKDAIFNNTRSTRDLCILAENMKQLVVLLHVSSTYAHTDKPVVEEILYPSDSNFDWKKTIKIVESIDDHVLRISTAKYLGIMPNTYTFSKRLAEQIISDYSESLPSVIIRPSIVISTLDDPVAGWIDNFNGPIGMLIGGGKGVLRVLWSDPTIISDFAPVDAAIKGIIITAWKRGIKTEDKTTDVYNCSSSQMKSMSIDHIVRIGFSFIKDVPMNNTIWKPGTTITKSYWIYYISVLLLHILPAIFLDGVMKLLGVRPILFRIQKKVYVSNKALSYFLFNQWKFVNTKLLTTLDNLSADNKKEFEFPYQVVDLLEYFKKGMIGAKLYLLNEKINDPETKRHYNR